MSTPILTGRSVVKSFGARGWFGGAGDAKRAVDTIDLDVNEGETLAIVGESGSGKSTLARMLLGLSRPTSGEVAFHGQSIRSFASADWATFRKAVQPIFQDPASSLNPRMSIGQCVAEPLHVQTEMKQSEIDAKVRSLLDSVELGGSYVGRYPHELSGGQRQRVSLARALALDPDLLIADEPTSALDVSVQARVLELFTELQQRLQFACLFISHDLAVVDTLANRVAVMQNGKLVEIGPREQVLGNPQEDYTKRLIAAVPVPDPDEQRRRREARGHLLTDIS
jgi:peptide/nickel transport system ATP-binding protein